jgi:4-hydroxy-3-polyprenylbenzoate decarboxylase/2,5-furandicarboxylate decarboxylase 1
VFELRAITHRRDPIYLAGLTGEPSTDNHVLKQAIYEAIIHRRLPTFAAQSRDIMMAAHFAQRVRSKVVIVVDDDIDPRDPDQVEWAIAYRTQADRDVVILPRMRGFALDPSSPEPWVGSVMGIDATRPFGKPFPERTRVPGAEDFSIPGWTD